MQQLIGIIRTIDYAGEAEKIPASTGDGSDNDSRVATLKEALADSQAAVLVAKGAFANGAEPSTVLTVLNDAGVRCVIARSFGRRFFRRAVNAGLALIATDLDGHATDGATAAINLRHGTVTIGDYKASFASYPDRLARVIEYGGLINAVKKELGKG